MFNVKSKNPQQPQQQQNSYILLWASLILELVSAGFLQWLRASLNNPQQSNPSGLVLSDNFIATNYLTHNNLLSASNLIPLAVAGLSSFHYCNTRTISRHSANIAFLAFPNAILAQLSAPYTFDLNSTPIGETTFINAGGPTTVTYAPDINGDNIPEILIGVSNASLQGRVQAGSTYLLWGNRSLSSIVDLASWNSSNLGIRFDGALAKDFSGISVKSIPDINGDNIPEILIGASGASPQGRTGAGSTYLIWGNHSLATVVDLATWNTSNFGIRFDGALSNDGSGNRVASTLDINKDNIPEILIVAVSASNQGRSKAGSIYLIWGNISLSSIVDLAAWDSSNLGIRFDGPGGSISNAISVTSITDVNGDDIPEIIIGDRGAVPLGKSYAGSTYLIWGNRSLTSIVDLATWNISTLGIRFDGASASDQSGISVASVPDINGDNIPEILIGADYASPQERSLAGSTYLIWGNPALASIVDLASWNTSNLGIRFDGAGAVDNSGYFVTSVPDVNGDNIPEILIGAYFASPQGRGHAGSSYLIWGNPFLPTILDLATWNTSNLGIRFDGAVAGDNSGLSVASISDSNNHERPAILIGTGTGKATLIFSELFGFAKTLTNPTTTTTTKDTSGSAINLQTSKKSTTLSTAFISTWSITGYNSNKITPNTDSSSPFNSTVISYQPTLFSGTASLATSTQISKPSSSAIIGGVVGGAAVVALLAGIGIYGCRKKRGQRNIKQLNQNGIALPNLQNNQQNLPNEYSKLPAKASSTSNPTPASHYDNILPVNSADPYAANNEQWLSVRELNEDNEVTYAKEKQKNPTSHYANVLPVVAPDSYAANQEQWISITALNENQNIRRKI